MEKERKFYDPEYDMVVDESVPKRQYAWFHAQSGFHKTYEEFLKDNFTELKDGENGEDLIYGIGGPFF